MINIHALSGVTTFAIFTGAYDDLDWSLMAKSTRVKAREEVELFLMW
jgi:hypothetical protein